MTAHTTIASAAGVPDPVAPARATHIQLLPLFVLVIWMVVSSVAVFLRDPQQAEPSVYVLGVALLWVSFTPMITWLTSTSVRRSHGFVPLFGIVYFIYYGNTVFSARPIFNTIKRPVSRDSIEPALLIATLGITSLVLAYYLSARLVVRIPRPRVELDIPRCVPYFIAISVVSVTLGVALFGRVGSQAIYAQPVSWIQYFGTVSLCGLIVARCRGHLSRGATVYLVGAAFVQSALGLATGALAPTLLSLLPLLYTYVWERARWPWGWIAVCLLFLTPFQATKSQYRNEVAFGPEDADQSAVGRFKRLINSSVDQFEHGLDIDEVGDSSGQRTNYLSTLAFVVEATPREVPYWDGYTYSDIAWRFIPRVLLPQRPILYIGQEFPRRYGIIDYGDDRTSYNLAQLVEMYINFGPTGVLVGMMVIGTIFRLLQHLTVHSSGMALIGAQLLANLMNMESNFSPVYGSLLYTGIVLYLFVRILPRQRSAPV
jgi:hypothetical protein